MAVKPEPQDQEKPSDGAEREAERIREIVDRLPALTEEQRGRLALLLRAVDF